MALKDTWVDKVDGQDDVVAKDINDIARSVIDLEDTKVDKEEGKQLSSNDFTNTDKEKLDNLPTKTENDKVYASKTDLNKANSLFANALKDNASGEIVSIKDISPVEHNLGVKVSSKNLIVYPYFHTTRTTNGITFTDNGDGSITANGTATANAYFHIVTISNWDKAMPISAGTYTLSGCPNGGSSTTYGISLGVKGNEDSNRVVYTDFGNGKTFIPQGGRYDCLITIYAGVTVNNVVFKPQLEKGTTATGHTPYIAELNKATVNRLGKNILPFPYYEGSRTTNGITFTVNDDGSVTANGTATALTNFLFVDRHTFTLPAGTYTFSLTPQLTGSYYLVTGGGGLSSANGNRTVNFKDGLVGYVCLQINQGTVLDNVRFYPQIEVGATATEPKPYIEPASYPVTADGTVEGVKSIYPNTTLLTDTSGVLIECEYNKDINKAFAELQNAIISLGGNV
jgi:hypothetical protein